jgi:hypothetical protein
MRRKIDWGRAAHSAGVRYLAAALLAATSLGVVNFAGGLRQEQCTGWQRGLVGAAGAYGKETRVPSLWFQGDNDSYFDQPTYRGMHEQQYTQAGGKAQLVAFGTFGADSHSLFQARAGASIWQPEMTERQGRVPALFCRPRRGMEGSLT